MTTSTTTVPTSFGRGTVTIQCNSSSICNNNPTTHSLLIVTLNRPKVKNAMNDHVYLDLLDCMELVLSNNNNYAGILLTGTGDYFSSGADLTSSHDVVVTTNDTHDNDTTDTISTLQHRPAGQFMKQWISFPKLKCAAVNGPAIGIAVTLLFHCDLVWCSGMATFWTPFARLALVPELCSSVTMVETMGISKANELLLLGRKIDATTALNWNIVSRVVDIADYTTATTIQQQEQPLAMIMAHDITSNLLSLVHSDGTIAVFCQLIRGKSRMERLQRICEEELIELDKRMMAGECLEAAMQLHLGKKKRSGTSTTTTTDSEEHFHQQSKL